MLRTASIVLVAVITSVAAAQEPNELTTKDKLALAAKLSSSFVRVEYTLRYDNADVPEVYGWQRQDGRNSTELLRDERPLERPGYLIAPDIVATYDIIYDTRFIESIKVRFGENVVSATPKAYGKSGLRLFLKLEKPLDGTTPLIFDAGGTPAFLVTCGRFAGQWGCAVYPFDITPYRVETGSEYARTGEGVIISQEGAPVGLSLDRELPADDSWKGTPSAWPLIQADEMARLEKATLAIADSSILLARLNFRSPRAGASYGNAPEEASATELFCPAILVDPNRVLVLADLSRQATARLEHIAVDLPGGTTLTASFSASLRNYGALLASLDSPVKGAVTLSNAETPSFRNRLLPAVNVLVRGSNRISRPCHVRFFSFTQGFRGELRPELENAPDCFVFDEAGKLAALPLVRRSLFEDGKSDRESIPQQVAAVSIGNILADLKSHIDLSNVPVSEEDENRLAWLGVELQSLDRELARANNVSHLTNEGEIGAIVSYVYPGSPAAEAGIEPGAVLLKIRIAERPLPIEIRHEQDDFFGGGFPWDRLDEIPEQYFDEIPKPWPGADSSVNKTLTDIGFGRKFTIEYVQDGKEISKELTVTASPMHYDSAPRYLDSALGLTVRDLTYEVRRYFQRGEEDGGVIVSKVEPGSRASVTGIKPYEIITHVNDRPVMTAKDFEEKTKGQRELRLSVKRMMRGRVVKISLDSAGLSEPNTQ